jgi:uncharacterized membrane protein YphA (DoxX/SURF4 family)
MESPFRVILEYLIRGSNPPNTKVLPPKLQVMGMAPRQSITYIKVSVFRPGNERKFKLQVLFSTFPRGVPGLGSPAVAGSSGGILVVQGISALTSGIDPTSQNSILSIVEVLSGAALLLGLITPIAGTLAVLLNLGMAVSWVPEGTWKPHPIERSINSYRGYGSRTRPSRTWSILH